MRIPTHRAPITPGEMLEEEFLKPLDISQSELARRLGVPFQRAHDIVRGKRAVTADTALRLGLLFNTTAEYWLNLQHARDLYELRRSGAPRDMRREVKPLKEHELARAG